MSEKLEEFDNRIIFAKTLIALANENPKIVVVCNDSVGSSNLGEFRELFPDRLIDVGIAEQNMVGVAAGLANAGFTPFVCAAAPFLTGRALEQIKADVVYTRTNVKPAYRLGLRQHWQCYHRRGGQKGLFQAHGLSSCPICHHEVRGKLIEKSY